MVEPMQSSSGLKLAPAKTGRSFLLPAIVLIVVAVIGVAIWLSLKPLPDGEVPRQVADTSDTNGEPTPVLETPSDVTDPDQLAVQPPGSVAPSFDIVQVDRDGQTVAAGRAEPGATVMIYQNGAVVAEVQADSRGEWIWTPADPLAGGNQVLQLRVNQDDGEMLSSQPIVVLGAEGQEAGDLEVAQLGDEPVTGEGQRAVIALGDAEGETLPRVLQSPGSQANPATEPGDTSLSLGTVRYSTERPMQMTGTGPAGKALTITLDGENLGQVLIDGDGSWEFESSVLIAPGDHTVTLTTPDGAAEQFPFTIGEQQETQAVADAPDGVGRSGDRIVIIERGNNLWRIAEATYGSGFRYTVIFEANQEQITDPDLIFPGQVFVLPVMQ